LRSPFCFLTVESPYSIRFNITSAYRGEWLLCVWRRSSKCWYHIFRNSAAGQSFKEEVVGWMFCTFWYR